MRRSLVKFSGPEASNHTPSLADFITTTSGFELSVHTPARLRSHVGRAVFWHRGDGIGSPAHARTIHQGSEAACARRRTRQARSLFQLEPRGIRRCPSKIARCEKFETT